MWAHNLLIPRTRETHISCTSHVVKLLLTIFIAKHHTTTYKSPITTMSAHIAWPTLSAYVLNKLITLGTTYLPDGSTQEWASTFSYNVKPTTDSNCCKFSATRVWRRGCNLYYHRRSCRCFGFGARGCWSPSFVCLREFVPPQTAAWRNHWARYVSN